MKKDNKNIKDESIRDFIETIDGFTPEQIKACEVYSDHIVYFLRLFDLHIVENLFYTTDRLKDLRDHSEKYLSSDLFKYILYMCESTLEDVASRLSKEYPEFHTIGKNGKVVFRLDLAEEKRHRDWMEHLRSLPFEDESDIDTEDEDW